MWMTFFIASVDDATVLELNEQLTFAFKIRDLGLPKIFLGLEIDKIFFCNLLKAKGKISRL